MAPYSEFDWDDYNSGKNLQKHGVFDEEIEQVFENPNIVMQHTKIFRSAYCAGCHNGGRYLFMAVQHLSKDCCRPIHARDMESHERQHYIRMVYGSRR